MDNATAIIARNLLKATEGYEELVQEFPKFSEAVKALPDEGPLLCLNPVLQEIIRDAVARAQKIHPAAGPGKGKKE